MQSRVDVGGTVHFIENSAMNGGGLALEDQCLVFNIMPYTYETGYYNIVVWSV